ncbi:methylmalonic aciduria type A homolog, mitochondrial-like isoform X2 [Antedon mediterranea]|uniref:methylmalonic aciduria type A homolog, mitochondrial-like isoform X2 n=1 Tax=Antedon mediterranea TaxID=105859 RepID=UPI003AF51516
MLQCHYHCCRQLLTVRSFTINCWAAAVIMRSFTSNDRKVQRIYDCIIGGKRHGLAEGITLVESTHSKKKKQAQELLTAVLAKLKVREDNARRTNTFRIGLTGPPGAGKSTLIEALGKHLTAKDHKVAVLAVDPSSSLTGGVGQSEYAVADMVDMFVLIVPPAGGDELQGLKRGIVEMADLILVNKSDGELLIPARRMKAEYTSAMKLLRKRSKIWIPKVLKLSSKTKEGLPEAWDKMCEFKSVMTESGDLIRKRQRQQTVWMWNHIRENIMDIFKSNTNVANSVNEIEREVGLGVLTPGHGADLLLQLFRLGVQENKL